MTFNDVKELLNARVFTGEDKLERETGDVCGADIMSEVLASSKRYSLLMTALCSQQALRTAEMVDITCVVFTGGKQPDEKMLDMAADRDLLIMSTDNEMYTACGLLYSAGAGADDTVDDGKGHN